MRRSERLTIAYPPVCIPRRSLQVPRGITHDVARKGRRWPVAFPHRLFNPVRPCPLACATHLLLLHLLLPLRPSWRCGPQVGTSTLARGDCATQRQPESNLLFPRKGGSQCSKEIIAARRTWQRRIVVTALRLYLEPLEGYIRSIARGVSSTPMRASLRGSFSP